MNNRTFFIILICWYCINGCATKGDNLIINSYSDKGKSVLLSDKGIQLYNRMIEKGDTALVPNIKNFLQESLKLDPENAVAGIYLQKTANYSEDTIAKFIKIAKDNLTKKKGRAEEDDYNLCLTLQKADQIDPSNNEIITLREQTKDIREQLAKKMLADGDAQLKLMEKIKNKIIQGKAIVSIMEKIDKALLLGSSQESNLAAKRSGFAEVLSGDMDFIISETKKLMEKSKYHDAEIRLKILNKYNLCEDHKYDSVLRDLQYACYFDWSKDLYKSHQIDQALEKIDLAVKLQKAGEALDLQTELQGKKNQAEVAASFDDRISDIDDLIRRKEIALAYQKINSIKTLTKAKGRMREVGKRKAKVMALIGVVYDDAVTDFVNGNYSSAVKEFQSVLAISRNYKDAGSYLKKAKSELKILDLY